MRIALIAALASGILPGLSLRPAFGEVPLRLKSGSRWVEFGTNGGIAKVCLTGRVPAPRSESAPLSFRLGMQEVTAQPVHAPLRVQNGIAFRYTTATDPRIDATITWDFSQAGKGTTVLRRRLELAAGGKLAGDLTVRLPLVPSALPDETWLPLKDGRGSILGSQASAVYRFAGRVNTQGARLALPLVTYPASRSRGRVTVLTDPYFSTTFNRNTIEWTYPAPVGLADRIETRLLATIMHDGTPESALDAFYAVAVPEVEPGPRWLHEIAMVDYDYMSDAGSGWSRDVAALASALPRGDRRQVLLCLHGWYDWVGRYSLDRKKGRFDPEWMNFGAYERVKNNNSRTKMEGVEVDVGFAKCVPTRLTPNDIRRRLGEAKAQGFRTAIYFADGMNAGDGLPDFSTNKVLRWGGWGGPDISGKTYVMNPLHPDVAPLYLELMDSMLREFGPQLDALVWDETFHVGAGDLGTASHPGYADRAMMRLTRDLSLAVQKYNRRYHRQVAFLASDAIGPTVGDSVPPYALVAHGTYQDSHCNPGAWSYGIFPNYRNALWSCCWWPVSKWDWVEFGVRNYQAPVAISNGWGDNLGFAECSPEQRQRTIELFRWRKQHPTKLRWIEQIPKWPVSK